MIRPVWGLYLVELFLLPASFDQQWYDSLQKPWFQPPSYLFGIAWGLLYPLLAYAYYLLLQQNDSRQLALFETQLALNLVWSHVFFTMKNIKLASLLLMAMILLNVSLRMPKWYLLYTGWLCFALLLNVSVRE